MKRTIILFSLLAILLPGSVFAADASCALLTRNLRVGDKGEDVRVLQRVLNANIATKIVSSGIGSPGNESTYFGKATKAAVIRFQNLYKSEVLTPAGLISGSGFVGGYSRVKLKSLCEGGLPQVSNATNVTTPTKTSATQAPSTKGKTATKAYIPGDATIPVSLSADPEFTPKKVSAPWMGKAQFDTLYILMVSDDLMRPGDTFTIYGTGFTPNTPNIVNIGSGYQIKNLGVDDNGLLTFVVPNDVPRGRNYIWVTNAKGTSNKDAFVVVPTPGRDGPKLRYGTPSAGMEGNKVTVFGSGFSTVWNDVHFPTGIIKGVKSKDGKSLSFIVPKADLGITSSEIDRAPDITSEYFIVNDYGVSEGLPFTIKF